MTDEHARAAQRALRTIRTALSEATLTHVETTAAIDGWLPLVAAEIAKRREQLKRGRRA